MQKAQRIQAFKGAGKGLFRRGLGIAGQVGGMFGSGLAIGGGGVVASALGTPIAPAATNAETATRTNVAKSYGVDVATFNAWDSLAKQYDMNAENIGDLFEEYLHKSGSINRTVNRARCGMRLKRSVSKRGFCRAQRYGTVRQNC